MDNSNKAIARRINKELKIRDMKQTDLLKGIIKSKNPNYNVFQLNAEVRAKKGNFSTALKLNGNRSISKEDLYIISKLLGVSLEYLWFGDDKKNNFVPKGARYVAFLDEESEYCNYIAGIEREGRIQYGDEFGYNLFEYFGQFDSINGYKFFLKNYNLHFDYIHYQQLMFEDSEGYPQACSSTDRENLLSDNLLSTLVKYKDVKTFKAIYFDNCSLKRFDGDVNCHRNKTLFTEDFVKMILENDSFLSVIFSTKEVELQNFYRHYDKGEKRTFVEPMFYEVLLYALKNENDYKDQLLSMLKFALEYNKSQYEYIKNYLKTHTDEYSDVRIDQYSPRFLRSSRNIPMGNVFSFKGKAENKEINDLIKEIEQHAFNMTHIINEQEKNDEEIKISTPDNPLFLEMHQNAIKQNVDYVPVMIHSDKEFTFFNYYEARNIDFENAEVLEAVIECLSKVQSLVQPKTNKVLVHGNLSGKVLMNVDGKTASLSGWQKCHYGSKYEDRAELLTKIDIYAYGAEFLEKFNKLFTIVSKGLNEEEKVKLIDAAINLLNERRKAIHAESKDDMSRAFNLKTLASRLEFFKEQYIDK